MDLAGLCEKYGLLEGRVIALEREVKSLPGAVQFAKLSKDVAWLKLIGLGIMATLVVNVILAILK